jgi:putative transposase
MDRLSEREDITVVCSALGIPRSSYYAYRSRNSASDHSRAVLRAKVERAFAISRHSAGSRTIRSVLLGKGIKVGRYKVRKLMHEARLVSKQPGKHAYRQARKEHADVPNRLNRKFDVSQPNQVWCGDITYIWAARRWQYLAAVLDLYARRVVGWAISSHANTKLTIKALDMAYQHRGQPPGVLFHSDQGLQYASQLFRQQLECHGMRQSMSRRGNCWDNAPMERLLRSLKSEWIPESGYDSVIEARRDIGFYLMHHYNHWRPHQYNVGLPPAKAEKEPKPMSKIT